MLPSTGYFKGINCPFYDSGLCERPYCHFRHVKKELQSTSNDEIESGAILQKLVSAAVQKVLQQTESSSSATLQPQGAVESIAEQNKTTTAVPAPKATYNPTPIAELNKINNVDIENMEDVNEQKKRHIPVPYTPRKPASLPIKRTFDNDSSSKPFVFIPPPLKYTPGCTDSIQLDQYTPKGTTESKEKYTPGVEPELPEYSPVENQTLSKINYIPSDKSVSKKKNILEYKPAKVAVKKDVPSVTYQPTPRSLAPCFSSDEDEPEVKKPKLSSDLNDLDDLEPEFDILDQILNEEKPKHEVNQKSHSDDTSKKKSSKDHRENNNEASKKDKKSPIKSDSKKNVQEKSKADKKDKSHEKDKHDSKSSSSNRKSSHKSSSRDKYKEKSKEDKKEKHKDKKYSSSRSSDRSSKHTEKDSKSSSKDLKRSSSSKSSSDRKNKEHKSYSSSRKSKEKQEISKQDDGSTNGFSDTDNHHISDDLDHDQNDDETYLSESDEETIALECKKIFEEYEPTEKVENFGDLENKAEDEPEEEYVPSKKRISRTLDKNVKIVPKRPIKPDFKLNAAQAMAERLAKIKEYHAAKNNLQLSNNEQTTTTKVDTARNNLNPPSSTKIRIAHVPYASTMMNAKKIIPPSQIAAKLQPSTSSTLVQTVKKGVQRVAHMPNEKFIDRPGVLEPLASKIPANIRSTYLNMMIDQCLNIYLSAVDAYARAQHEELATSKKCSTVPIYKNSAVLTVSRLKKELQECNGVKKSASDCNALQKLPQTISGKSNNAGSWSIENKNRKLIDSKEFNGAKLYSNVKKWILTEELLQSNGFPRAHPNGKKGGAKIYAQNKQKPPVGNLRMCSRCKKEFMIDKKGFAAVKEECIYHPNNKYRVRGEARYQCCSQDGMSDGCCVAPSHVYEYLDFDNLKGYVTTLPPERPSDDYGIYSLDCEMCYTTHGLDLTRVTVINSACKVVYETLVRPLHPIVDYNTRYSGITEQHMAEVKTTLLEVQATLLAMFSSKTILIGHSLESDFKALKLIHDTVIDTSVLFPHKMGPPYKRALRNLSSEYLKKIIQNSVDGHDSAEDAMVCMELIHYKLREELKTR